MFEGSRVRENLIVLIVIASDHVGFVSFNLLLQFPRVSSDKTGVEGKPPFPKIATLCWSRNLLPV